MSIIRLTTAALAAAILAGGATAPLVAAQTKRPAPKAPTNAAKAPQQGAYDDPGDDPIELSTDVVNVLFSVTDRTNKFVGDVKPEEIVLLENGVRQEVFAFSKELNLPLVVALVVDVSSSQEFTFEDEKRAASGFLQRVLKPRVDSAAVVKFREDTEFVQGFTNRLDRISDALNRITWDSRRGGSSQAGATALYDAIAVTATELFPNDQKSQSAGNLAERRAIVLLTDGADTASQMSMQQAIEEAIKADVIVYVVGIGDRYRSTSVKRDVLDVIARQTGGRAYFPATYDELSNSFRQIEDELRSQYLLAYEPNRVARDGSYREIKISIPSRPEYRVFHRKGYYAPRGIPNPSAPPAPASGATRP